MIAKHVMSFADMLIEKEICKEDDKEILIFGITTGLHWLLNIVTMIVLGILFDLVIESLVFLISFSSIRTFAGGYHCKKAINCYFFSSGIVALVLGLIKITPSKYIPIISFLLLLFSVPIIVKLSPVETPTKPLDEVEKEYFRKKTNFFLSLECILAGLFLILNLNDLVYIICLGIIVSTILVLF